MSNLYNNLSEVYEMMYHSFIDYNEEYRYYSSKLKKNNTKSVIELGCGTGNLAGKFIEEGFDYTGVDLNESMLEIARRKNPTGKFLHGDMRNFIHTIKKDACFFGGRTSAYLISDTDMIRALNAINKNLKENGIICFDSIDADKFLPQIKKEKRIVHTAEFKNRKFRRESHWAINEKLHGSFNWSSVYFEIDSDDKMIELGKDNSTIRTFTKNEIKKMLDQTCFDVVEIEDRISYAFDTFVVVAKKNDHGNV